MRDYDYENYGVTLSAPKYDKLNQPMPSREELLARNSFGSPDDNKFLNAPRKAAIATAEKALAKLKGESK